MTAAAALLLAILIWAFNSVLVKIVRREISPQCGLVIAGGVYLLNRT